MGGRESSSSAKLSPHSLTDDMQAAAFVVRTSLPPSHTPTPTPTNTHARNHTHTRTHTHTITNEPSRMDGCRTLSLSLSGVSLCMQWNAKTTATSMVAVRTWTWGERRGCGCMRGTTPTNHEGSTDGTWTGLTSSPKRDPRPVVQCRRVSPNTAQRRKQQWQETTN